METGIRNKSVLSQYAALFRCEGVLPLVLIMIIARMPTGCFSMLLVLFVSVPYGAAAAGTASAAWTIGLAVLSPYLGRLVDRGFGPRTLQLTSLCEALAMGFLVVSVYTGAPVLFVLLESALCGALNPPVSGTTRSLWRTLVSEEILPIAYSFEILLIDALYVSGPLLASLFIAFDIPQVGMIVTTVCLVLGSVALSLSGPVKAYAQMGRVFYKESCEKEELQQKEKPTQDASLLRNPGVWAVLIACMGAMMFSGWMEALIPLHFSALGNAAQGSVAISLWSLGSIVGVLAFVRVQTFFSRFSLARQLVIFTALYLVPTVAVAFIANPGYVALCMAMTAVGVLVSPCTNLHYQVGGEQAPASRHAEMFSWLNTATSAGISLGALLAGNAIEILGSDASFGIPALFVALSLLAALVLVKFDRS